jgi:hypothetical protein
MSLSPGRREEKDMSKADRNRRYREKLKARAQATKTLVPMFVEAPSGHHETPTDPTLGQEAPIQQDSTLGQEAPTAPEAAVGHHEPTAPIQEPTTPKAWGNAVRLVDREDQPTRPRERSDASTLEALA